MLQHVSFMSAPGQAWRPVPSELHPLLPSARHPVLCIVRLSSLMWRQARLFSCSETHMQRDLIPAHANWWKPLKATGNLARNEHMEVVQKYFIRREEMFQQGTGTRRRSVVKWPFFWYGEHLSEVTSDYSILWGCCVEDPQSIQDIYHHIPCFILYLLALARLQDCVSADFCRWCDSKS